MDSILTGLMNFGIGGMMAAVVAYFLRHLITVTIPTMSTEHGKALESVSVRHNQALKDVMDNAKELNKVHQEIYKTSIEALVSRLERIAENASINSSRVEELTKHIQANEEHLRLFQEFVTRKLDERK